MIPDVNRLLNSRERGKHLAVRILIFPKPHVSLVVAAMLGYSER